MGRIRELAAEVAACTIAGAAIAIVIPYRIYAGIREKISSANNPLKEGQKMKFQGRREKLKTARLDNTDYLVRLSGTSFDILGEVKNRGIVYTTGDLNKRHLDAFDEGMTPGRKTFYDISPIPEGRLNDVRNGITQLLRGRDEST